MGNVKLLDFVLTIAAILAAVRIMYFFRARAMQRLASKWGFQYIGPTTPPQWWLNTFRPKIPAPLPGWFSRLGISQAWNIIEGKNNGTQLFIFDGVVGTFKSYPCSYIACQAEQSPFPMPTSAERVKQIRGWTFLRGVWFLWFSWLMGTRRIDRHLRYLLSE
jgi:hypothetical protein